MIKRQQNISKKNEFEKRKKSQKRIEKRNVYAIFCHAFPSLQQKEKFSTLKNEKFSVRSWMKKEES